MKLTAWGDAPYEILDIRDDTDGTRLGSVHAAHPGWAAVCARDECADPRHEGEDAKDATIALFAHWQHTHWQTREGCGMNADARHCPICRDLFDEVRDAWTELRNAKPFAHAHHTITGRTEMALVGYLAKAADYRIHKGQCRQARLTRRGVAA